MFSSCTSANLVSIRHADFLLFERPRLHPGRSAGWLFQSAMRIFCCSNAASVAEAAKYGRVSIRHADFLLFERPTEARQ